MATFRQGEYWFLSEVCSNLCCVLGEFEKCNKSHQILKRKIQTHQNGSEIEEIPSQAPKIDEETDHDDEILNCQPRFEFDNDFEFNESTYCEIKSDNEIELSDNDDDFPVSRNSTYSFDSDMNALRQAVLKYPVKRYFSTDQSLLELEINADYHDSFSNMVSNSLSNERSFGPRELYLNDFTRLNGTNWANDKVMDAMFDIVQRKCCSLGIPVVAIPVAWYYFFTVSFS